MTAGRYSIGSDVLPGLSKLIEECGEVIQIAGKIIATNGEAEHWDHPDLFRALEDEMGDLSGAIQFLTSVEGTVFSAMRVEDRGLQKLAVFERWHAEQRT